MSLPAGLNAPRLTALAVALALLFLAFIYASRQSSNLPWSSSGQIWYFDLGTGKPFAAKANPPPAAAPSGKEAVTAAVFTCGDFADDAQRFVAYIEKPSPDTQAPGHLGKAGPAGGRLMSRGQPAASGSAPHDAPPLGRLVAKPQTNPTWVDLDSADGRDVLAQTVRCDGGAVPKRCLP